MKRLIYLLIPLALYGCSEQCTECTEVVIIEEWNINANTESVRDSVTMFEVCDVNGVNVVDGLVVVGDVQEVENNVFKRLTTSINCN
jgi:hypothetical protein